MTDLTLVPLDDLINELNARHDHLVIMGMKVMNEPEDAKKCTDIVVIRRWKGNSMTCAGLCSSLSRSILEDYHSRETSIPEGDQI